MSELRKSEFLGVPFVAEPPDTVVEWLLDALTPGSTRALPVHLIPAHGVAELPKDEDFADVLRAPGLVIPDGRWLELLTRNRSVPLFQFRGTDVLLRMCDEGRNRAAAHYFLGSSEEVLASFAEKLRQQFPGITIAGVEPYPFDELPEQGRADLVARIRQSRASVVWMGISTPRQNKEALWLAELAQLPVICVGAAVEFVAGFKKAAPGWVQRLGMEWLFRFLTEPKRLWRRYVWGTFAFVRLYLSDQIRPGASS